MTERNDAAPFGVGEPVPSVCGPFQGPDTPLAASPAQEATPPREEDDVLIRTPGPSQSVQGRMGEQRERAPLVFDDDARAAPTPEASDDSPNSLGEELSALRARGNVRVNDPRTPEASAPEPMRQGFAVLLTGQHTAEVHLGPRVFVRDAMQGMQGQWSERMPDGHFRFAHAKEWLDRIATLEATVAALTAEREALREVVQDFALVERHAETRAGSSDCYRMPFRGASWFDSREAAVTDWLAARAAPRGETAP